MPKVQDYQDDQNISNNDKLLGTDGDDANKTKNYSVGQLLAYFSQYISIGAPGLSILNGVIDPTNLIGRNGEFYINTVSHTFFGPKASGAWPVGFSLVGPQGPQGPQGPSGIITKISGTITLSATPQVLTNDINSVSFSGGIAYLPDTTEIGKEVLVFTGSNYVEIRANSANTNRLFFTPSSLSNSIKIYKNQVFKFTYIGFGSGAGGTTGGYWIVQNIVKNQKNLNFYLAISGTTATPTFTTNEFPEETITLSIPSNGKLRIDCTNNRFTTGKTKVKPIMFDNGGIMYFGIPIYDFLPSFIDIDFRKYDNTQSSTPSVSGIPIEITVDL